MKLNLGCGDNYRDGYINLDNNGNLDKIDVKHDLNRFPYPFNDSTSEEIIMDHILEHLDDTISVISELYRISKNGAIINIKSPHFSCNWTHPGHKRAIGLGLFDHFSKDSAERYGKCDFRVEYSKLYWIRPCYVDSLPKRVASSVINFFANLNKKFCERFWCYWVGGFEEIEFKVRVEK